MRPEAAHAAPGSARGQERGATYRRVLLKLSGEALMGDQAFGLDRRVLDRIAGEVKAVHQEGVQVAIVVGGGNIFRGAEVAAAGIERATGDSMGMLATVMNALALQSVLERRGVAARVQSAIPMPQVCEPFLRARALRHLEKGRVVVFAAGTGNPFFTTDTAAALRAVEIGCDALLKGTQVDGVYSADPKRDPGARRYERLRYQDVLAEHLQVMDTAAIALARDNRIPVVVFSIHEPGGFAKVVRGGGRFTIISEGGVA
jgi:uridylate kinase